VLFRSQLCALVLTAPVALAGAPGSDFTWQGVTSVVALGVGATALAFVAMVTLTGRAGATRASIAVYFTPLVAIAVGVAFRDEHVAAASIAGVLLVLLGAWLTSRAERPVTLATAGAG
jgi:drug/metabolite transporter (DMT)-like permease